MESEFQYANGMLTHRQAEAILEGFPAEITFIDDNDRVMAFSHLPEELFKRPAKMLGRDVKDCHPKKSWPKVEELLRQFKAGERDLVEFWFDKGGEMVYVRYMPLREDDGTYIGCLEVAQRCGRIRELHGEKRSLS